MIQVSTPHPNPVLVKALFERLSPQSRALVMRDRSMMPKVVAALSSHDGGQGAHEDDGALGGSWNPLANPLIAEAATAISGAAQTMSDAVFGPSADSAHKPAPTTERHDAASHGQAAPAGGTPLPASSKPADRGLMTRPGTPIYSEPGGKALLIKSRTPVTVVETRIDDASMANGNGTEEMGKVEWTHIRSEDGSVDGWVKFGAVSTGDELSDAMGSATKIPTDKIKEKTQRAVAQIWNEKGGYIDANRGALARAVAVMKVESGGLGFTATGNATIRFEVHKFFRNAEGLSVDWGKTHAATFDQHFRPQKGAMEHEINVAGADAGGAWSRYHGSQSLEWAALDLATSLSDRETALRCISIGAGQVMGFNAPKLGYANATEMFDTLNGDAKANVGGIFGFIKANPTAAAALAAQDYVGFAAEYNGATYAADYGRFIAEAVKAFEVVDATYLQGAASS